MILTKFIIIQWTPNKKVVGFVLTVEMTVCDNAQIPRPCLHGSAQIFDTDINLHGSTMHLHGTGGTGQIFERLSVQVWDLEKAGQLFDWHVSIFCMELCKHHTMQHFAQIAWLRPGI